MITLRKADKKDLEVLISIEKTVSHLKTYSATTTKKEWNSELTKSTVYIIEKDGAPVGDISYKIKNKKHAYISGFAIVPKFQGQGIGRQVLAKVLNELQAIKRIDLVTHPHNTHAIMLYLSLGFVIESWKNNYYGDGQPRLVLVKST